jgi:hypothetical protein
MSKIIQQWMLFKYTDGKVVPLSKPFKTKKLAEKARLKYPERERKGIGLGLIRIKS